MQSQRWASAVFFTLFLMIAVPPLRMAAKRQQARGVQERILAPLNSVRPQKQQTRLGEKL
jgi:BarA-like signal transduction histidine kinase